MLRHEVNREYLFPKHGQHPDDRAPDDLLNPVEPPVVIRQALFEFARAAFERDGCVRVSGPPPPLAPSPEAVLALRALLPSNGDEARDKPYQQAHKPRQYQSAQFLFHGGWY